MGASLGAEGPFVTGSLIRLIIWERMVIRGNRMVAGEFTSRERLFIECHIARHYDRAVGWIPKLIPLGTRLIPHEDHLDSLLVELAFAL